MHQIVLKMRSKQLMQKPEICILLPETPVGQPHSPCKALWLLHGGTCDFEDYLYRTRITSMLHRPDLMVIIPNGLNSDFANHMEFANGYPYADFFFDELMPFIYTNFNVSARPADNYLAGYSMGGAASLMYALYRPGAFAQVGVLGSSVRESAFLRPYLELTGAEFKKLAFADPKKLPTEFGDPAYGITRKEINMIGRYDTVRDYVDSMECTWERFTDAAKDGRVPNLLFCCGDQDGCCEKVLEFRDYAGSLGVTGVRFEIVPGYGHDREDVPILRALELMGLTSEDVTR